MNPARVAAVLSFVFCSGKSAAEILRDAVNRAVAKRKVESLNSNVRFNPMIGERGVEL